MQLKTLNLGDITIDKLLASDIDAYFLLMNDAHIAQGCGFEPINSKRKAELLLQSDIDDNTVAIRDSKSNQLIGLINLFETIGVNNEPTLTELDLGYLISRDYSHKGYMTLALSKVIDLIRSMQTTNKIFGTFKKGNLASMKVLKNNGFVKDSADTLTETWVLNLK
ncbi:GNAT family N-acetyltransferase [Apilactobacillus xinyiensis]|uniref:GNAT family N-acetyltransferase n=1 Tax=Apilactobacillus xinyiensis TaxID=2841032 RepID=A0ABT0I1A2_9LACO|nr:GNAT family N-acetyltransferase [Apilactobacillus xinyiensis]MCK8624369.1 GNAT family N-acetyltransferase [Apilactobacillus xinyiensis]MCL0311961.1 GNAT family N-acetyltransferase [Apilactobacillus xinyiensis]MCL0319431.1 GNAT family N-acetyltransferase [Apilactobacillus xinyiensis]MCL0329641.1 GNAT family N-acetyltransferase [Apilactobacillus xinyiensis]